MSRGWRERRGAEILLASNVELLAFRFVQAPLVLHILQSDDETLQDIHLQKRRYTRYVLECVTTCQFRGTPLLMHLFHSRAAPLSCCPLVCFWQCCVWSRLTVEKQHTS